MARLTRPSWLRATADDPACGLVQSNTSWLASHVAALFRAAADIRSQCPATMRPNADQIPRWPSAKCSSRSAMCRSRGPLTISTAAIGERWRASLLDQRRFDYVQPVIYSRCWRLGCDPITGYPSSNACCQQPCPISWSSREEGNFKPSATQLRRNMV